MTTTLAAFGHDTWWLVVGKALAIFVFLMLNVLVAILLERNVLGPLVAHLAAPYAALSLAAGTQPLLVVLVALALASLAAGAIVARRASAVSVTVALTDL